MGNSAEPTRACSVVSDARRATFPCVAPSQSIAPRSRIVCARGRQLGVAICSFALPARRACERLYGPRIDYVAMSSISHHIPSLSPWFFVGVIIWSGFREDVWSGCHVVQQIWRRFLAAWAQPLGARLPDGAKLRQLSRGLEEEEK